MLLLAMVFLAGVVHGLGPDHLAAISAFGAVAGNNFRRLTFFSVRFAVGHAMVIAGAALLAHFGRLALPAAWERRFDLGAAALLLITGIALLVGLISGHISLHAHEHRHHGLGAHRHYHAHIGTQADHQHKHGKLAFVLGGLFALGGARSLILFVPVALASTFAASLLRIAAFTLGIAAAMSAYGYLAGGVLGRATHWGNSQRQQVAFRLATGGVGVFCIVAGLITLSQRLYF
jgi:ABC-type nickel/cobalt efflux system permease component RcnA